MSVGKNWERLQKCAFNLKNSEKCRIIQLMHKNSINAEICGKNQLMQKMLKNSIKAEKYRKIQ
jgi:hypothetical protein